MTDGITIRPAELADLGGINAIYNYYIRVSAGGAFARSGHEIQSAI